MTRLAKAYAPNHIRDAISSHVESKSDGTYLIRTVANRKTAPDARAWEYGSGLRARRGTKQKYIIAPKNKPYLAFPWERISEIENGTWLGGEKLIKKAKDGRAIFEFVEHPGIKAANEGRGYIAPAQVELRKKARSELDLDTRNAIMGDLRTSFGRKA